MLEPESSNCLFDFEVSTALLCVVIRGQFEHLPCFAAEACCDAGFHSPWVKINAYSGRPVEAFWRQSKPELTSATPTLEIYEAGGNMF